MNTENSTRGIISDICTLYSLAYDGESYNKFTGIKTVKWTETNWRNLICSRRITVRITRKLTKIQSPAVPPSSEHQYDISL
jgi:hypothetical protein